VLKRMTFAVLIMVAGCTPDIEHFAQEQPKQEQFKVGDYSFLTSTCHTSECFATFEHIIEFKNRDIYFKVPCPDGLTKKGNNG